MPTDEDMETEVATKALSKVHLEDDDSVQVVSGKIPPAGAAAPANFKPKVKKFSKKKGGHISKKKRW